MEQLGIEPVQLLMQVVNFGLMVFVLTKFLYRPIIKKLEERKKKIKEGLAFSEKMELETEKLNKQKEEVLNRAKAEARKIVEEGKKAGKTLEAEIVAKANGEAEGISSRAKKQLEIERREIERELKAQTVEIVESMVERLLRDVLTAEDQHKIIRKKIEEISHIKR